MSKNSTPYLIINTQNFNSSVMVMKHTYKYTYNLDAKF